MFSLTVCYRAIKQTMFLLSCHLFGHSIQIAALGGIGLSCSRSSRSAQAVVFVVLSLLSPCSITLKFPEFFSKCTLSGFYKLPEWVSIFLASICATKSHFFLLSEAALSTWLPSLQLSSVSLCRAGELWVLKYQDALNPVNYLNA